MIKSELIGKIMDIGKISYKFAEYIYSDLEKRNLINDITSKIDNFTNYIDIYETYYSKGE